MDLEDRGNPHADAAADDVAEDADGFVPRGLRRRLPGLATTRIEEWLVGQSSDEDQANGSAAPVREDQANGSAAQVPPVPAKPKHADPPPVDQSRRMGANGSAAPTPPVAAKPKHAPRPVEQSRRMPIDQSRGMRPEAFVLLQSRVRMAGERLEQAEHRVARAARAIESLVARPND